MSEQTKPVPACPYCSKPMEQPHKARIVDRGYDPVRRKQFVRTRELEFCSPPCAGNYQMGCEG